MKKSLLFCALGLVAAAAGAQETGRVLSSTPVVQQVAVPRQVCNPGQAMAIEQPHATSGMGGLLGAIAGGAIGSQIGSGNGRAAATMAGVIGGALLGNHAEGGNRPVPQHIASCTTQTFTENRTVGYDVTYEYAGRQYTVRMPHDPGPTVRLQVSPIGSSGIAPAPSAMAPYPGDAMPAPMMAPAPMMMPPVAVMPQVIVPAVVPSYYYRPAAYSPYAYGPSYYPPVSLSIGLNWSNGPRYRGYRHRHWR
jgi:uncharacterized protein YcfJ